MRKLVRALGSDFSSTLVIGQHMANPFMQPFVTSLKQESQLPVVLATDEMELEASTLYVVRAHTQIIQSGHHLHFRVDEDRVYAYNPDINVLFTSCMGFSQNIKIMAVILTGMGSDGTEGMHALYVNQHYCMVESQQSAPVYGMPKSALDRCEQIASGSLEDIISEIKRFDHA